MPTGIIKFFNSGWGYGFIKPDGGGADEFVHATALEDSGVVVTEGDAVSYDIVPAPAGKTKAANVRRLKVELREGNAAAVQQDEGPRS